MKNPLKILTALILFFSINIAFANSTKIKSFVPQEQELPKQQNGINDQNGQLEDSKSEESTEFEYDQTEDTAVDSVEDDSVSKYNFIFYFLYKFKYEEEVD